MKLARGALLLVATLFVVTACTSEPEPTPTPTPTPTATSASPSPTESESPTPSPEPDPSPSPTAFQSFPPPPQGETEEQAAIRAAWQQYELTIDTILRDPEIVDFTETQRITTGDEANRILDELALAREANIKLEGDRLYRDVEIGEPVTGSDGVRSVMVDYCFDPESQRIVDAASGELYENARTDPLRSRVQMVLGKDDRWRVAEYWSEAEPC